VNIGREGRGVERDGKVCEGDAIRFALKEYQVLPPIGKGREGVPWGGVMNSRTLSCLPCHASYREFAECRLATPLPSFRPAGRVASGIVAACQSAEPWIDV
jgi:hypothetical protein